ncbi:MAG: DUF3883 domain-containing protein [Acidobacteria bacterium]|nr:DUF3883 domain-containing protein [Acidobacteriota bacterium]
MLVTDDNLFLDDLNDDQLKGRLAGFLLATPGHLGETSDEQDRVASLLQLRRLSSRFTVTPDLEDEQALPESWREALAELLSLVQSYAQDEDGAASPFVRPVIAYYQRIHKSLMDKGSETSRWAVRAVRDGARICLAGEPDDFAADFCRVLLQWAGLTNRRDLDELAPTITSLIGWMGRPDKFVPRLAAVRAQRGLTPGPAPTPEPGTPPEPPVPKPPQPTPPAPGTPPPGETSPPEEPTGDGGTPAPPGDEPPQPPPPSGGYTAGDRERRLKSLRKQREELHRQERELLGAAAVDYELLAGRFAETKDAGQPGYDIDSFDGPLDDPDRRLVRRIEVKGHGCAWVEDETVEVSDRQFLDALGKKCDGVALADDFDYWLYVVERNDDATLNVVPIRNPARRAAKFEFRSGTWRSLAEDRPSANEPPEE